MSLVPFTTLLAMSGPTEQRPAADVAAFLGSIDHEQRRSDAVDLLDRLRTTTGVDPQMWGSSIVGFGVHHYRYESGREGDTAAVGFSPRRQALVIYGLDLADASALGRLGPHSLGKGCLYIKNLSKIDAATLDELVTAAFAARNNAGTT